MTSRILTGNCLEVLATLPEASVQTCVTSPPYWSLRDYGVAPSVFGGDPTCAHVWATAGSDEGYASSKRWQHSHNGRGDSAPIEKQLRDPVTRETTPEAWAPIERGKFCTCGAWLGCLGLEPTPELYVAHLVEIFEAVRRVLRDDGTLWLNLGDCYTAARAAGSNTTSNAQKASRTSFRRDRQATGDIRHKAAPGLKSKDLVGIPWMVAFALRSSGWYLRSDIIWAKSNPMPESIADRPTKSHEYVFLLAKSESYFYDAEAIREPNKPQSIARVGRVRTGGKHRGSDGGQPRGNPHSLTSNLSNALNVSGRNRRTVWTLSTAPFPGAHFATFPPKLVEPCVAAGSSEHGCCSICRAPFKRIVTRGEPLTAQMANAGADANGEYHGTAQKSYRGSGAQDPSAVKARILAGMRERVTTGWKPTCKHTLRNVEPCTVLDPFAGAGTTGLVAARLGRSFIGIELNPDYVAMAERRVEGAVPA
jgi:DNA modification methylase